MYEIGKTGDNPDANDLAFLIRPKKLKIVLVILRHMQKAAKMKVKLYAERIQMQR